MSDINKINEIRVRVNNYKTPNSCKSSWGFSKNKIKGNSALTSLQAVLEKGINTFNRNKTQTKINTQPEDIQEKVNDILKTKTYNSGINYHRFLTFIYIAYAEGACIDNKWLDNALMNSEIRPLEKYKACLIGKYIVDNIISNANANANLKLKKNITTFMVNIKTYLDTIRQQVKNNNKQIEEYQIEQKKANEIFYSQKGINTPDLNSVARIGELEQPKNLRGVRGGKKKTPTKKPVKKSTTKKSPPKKKPTTKPKTVTKKSKTMTDYKKDDLVKIAKRKDVSLIGRDKKTKSKEQLYKSLKYHKCI